MEYRFEARGELARELARVVAEGLGRSLEKRDEVSLVVSGGSTPTPFFEALREITLDWGRVSVTLADERWVSTRDDASNERLVREILLQGKASEARLVGLKTDAATAAEGAGEAHRRLRAMPRPFDVVVLGMGGDGHTASLFPGAAELAAGLDLGSRELCLAVRPPEAPHERLSLTRAALLESRRRILHITGDAKWRVYRQAVASGPVEELPIRGFLRQPERPIDVYWAP